MTNIVVPANENKEERFVTSQPMDHPVYGCDDCVIDLENTRLL